MRTCGVFQMLEESLLMLRGVFVVELLSLIAFTITAGDCARAQQTSTQNAHFETQFEDAWNRIENQFYKPEKVGAGWAATKPMYLQRVRKATTRREFSGVMQDVMHGLAASHCAFWTVDDIEYYHLIDIFRAIPEIEKRVALSFPDGVVAYPGIDILPERRNGKWFIAGVLDGGVGESAGLHRGMELLSVEDEPYQPVRSFLRMENKPIRLTVRRFAGAETETLTVVPHAIEPQSAMLDAMKKSMRVIEFSGRKIAYVHVWSYAGKQFHELLEEELLSGVLSPADALVLDIRDGWGGATPTYLNLFNRNLPRLESIARNGSRFTYPTHWSKPVVLLVNAGSRSGKEVIAYAFKRFQIGPVVGSTTGGAVLAGTPILIGTDAVMYLAVAGIEVEGRVIEGEGVVPDYVVDDPLESASSSDPQLSKALEVAADLLKSKTK